MARLLQLEKRLATNPDLRKSYTEFINDVLLATAVIKVKNAANNFEYLREWIQVHKQSSSEQTNINGE